MASGWKEPVILHPVFVSECSRPRFLDRSVFLRELLPQDLQLQIGHLTREEAMKAAASLRWWWVKCMRGRWMSRRERVGRKR